MPRCRWREIFAVGVLGAFSLACSSGRQPLGWEISDPAGPQMDADTFEPWHGGPPYYGKWSRGLPTDPNHFPISVWMQNPLNAERFSAAGVNFFSGLWQGPTEDQLNELGAVRMPAVCHQAGVWQEHVDDPTILAWLMPDGPDNAQLQEDGSYGPCLEPAAIIDKYRVLIQNDATRPVFLNLGSGVAEPEWEGRGSCFGRIDMYPEYARGADILAVTVYPVNQGLPLERVAEGVTNLRRWSGYQKPVFALIEASAYAGLARPDPSQIRAEVWMALTSGAAGIKYYCHRQAPTVSDTDCLDDAGSRRSLEQINRELGELAPVLNTASVANGVTVSSSANDVPIQTALKRAPDGSSYLFAVSLRGRPTRGRFELRRTPSESVAEALGEGRRLRILDGVFEDDFGGYAVHLYRVTPAPE